jgi:hypothetical protein
MATTVRERKRLDKIRPLSGGGNRKLRSSSQAIWRRSVEQAPDPSPLAWRAPAVRKTQVLRRKLAGWFALADKRGVKLPISIARNVARPAYSAYLYRLGRADERTRTADLISLRVIIQALQGCAGDCKSRISKRLSSLRVAECCTVLRS